MTNEEYTPTAATVESAWEAMGEGRFVAWLAAHDAEERAKRPDREQIEDAAKQHGRESGTQSRYGLRSEAIEDFLAGAEYVLSSLALEPEAREKWTGRVVRAEFSDGVEWNDCEVEDCYCTNHTQYTYPAGTYITVKLDEDYSVGLSNVTISVEE